MDRGIDYIDVITSGSEIPVSDFIQSLDTDMLPADFDSKEEYCEFAETIIGYKYISIETRRSEITLLNELINKFRENYPSLPVHTLLIVSEENIKNLGHDLIFTHGFENTRILTLAGNHCANIDHAINLACENTGFGNTLIVTFIKLKTSRERIFESYAIKGDGAAILLVSSQARLKQLRAVFLTHGRFSVLNKPKNNSTVNLKYYSVAIQSVLKGRSISEVDVILLQNANPLLFVEALKLTGLNESLVMTTNNSLYGHLDGIDLLINLKTLFDSRHEGKLILSLNTGWMGSYAAALYTVQTRKNETEA